MANSYDSTLESRLARGLGDGYALRELVGRGGFAVVYAATDTALKRDVAIKALRPELAADPLMRERFRREAEAVARLRHPHIVPIYSVGDGEGLVWYVMPLIAGPSLKARLERAGRLPLPEARRIFSEAAQALGAAHRAGIVHRDVKPDNILLDGAPPDARVLVTDFGIAKALGGDQTLTQSGVVIGTPQYMSPEQASGEKTDGRTDIYSLGVVAYQMLTGELPFEAGTVAGLLMKQLTTDVPNVLRKRPDCPSDLAVAVTRCLAKDPAHRWSSVDDLVRAIAPQPATVEAQRSRDTRALRTASPVHHFRVFLAVSLAVVVAGGIVDAARGRVLLGPIALLGAAVVLALRYGRLWVAGYAWTDVFKRAGAAGTTRSPTPLDSAEFGPHEGAVRQARAERAAIRAHLERVPRAGRLRFDGAVRAADALLAQAGALARQLYTLERQIDPGVDEIERRLAATEAEPSSPGRAGRIAVLQRRRDAVRALVGRREAGAEALGRTLGALAQLRAVMEQRSDDVQQAVNNAKDCLATMS